MLVSQPLTADAGALVTERTPASTTTSVPNAIGAPPNFRHCQTPRRPPISIPQRTVRRRGSVQRAQNPRRHNRSSGMYGFDRYAPMVAPGVTVQEKRQNETRSAVE